MEILMIIFNFDYVLPFLVIWGVIKLFFEIIGRRNKYEI